MITILGYFISILPILTMLGLLFYWNYISYKENIQKSKIDLIKYMVEKDYETENIDIDKL